jgi:hypothetical protein
MAGSKTLALKETQYKSSKNDRKGHETPTHLSQSYSVIHFWKARWGHNNK